MSVYSTSSFHGMSEASPDVFIRVPITRQIVTKNSSIGSGNEYWA